MDKDDDYLALMIATKMLKSNVIVHSSYSNFPNLFIALSDDFTINFIDSITTIDFVAFIVVVIVTAITIVMFITTMMAI